MTDVAPAPPHAPKQFRLRQLLALPLLVVVFFAVGGRTEPLLGSLAVVLLLMIVEAVSSCYYKRPFGGYDCLLIVTFLLLLYRFPAVSRGPEPSRRAMCTNNLKQIALALHEYSDRYHTFPPAYVADAQGRPMHSWRVLILPYIGERGLYEQYHFDEPWDGPNNRQLANQAPSLFRCPSDSGASPGQMNYVAVVGPRTAWPGSTGRAWSEISDNPSDTLQLVEVADASINWLEPRDLSFEELPLAVGVPKGRGISSRHPGGAQAAFVDGHIEFLPDSLPQETLRRLLWIDDGQSAGEGR